MAAHDGGYARPFFEKGKRRLCDRVVVQRLEDARQRIARRGAPVLRIIGEAPEINCALEGLVVVCIESAHQFLRAVERCADWAERYRGKHADSKTRAR